MWSDFKFRIKKHVSGLGKVMPILTTITAQHLASYNAKNCNSYFTHLRKFEDVAGGITSLLSVPHSSPVYSILKEYSLDRQEPYPS